MFFTSTAFYQLDPTGSGPVLYLDAGNISSYPGTGTTWTDLSGNNNNGTLINSPAFDSGNGGSIVFNGTNNYMRLGSPNVSLAPSEVTMLFWIYNNYPGYYLGVFQRDTVTGAALNTPLPWTGWMQVGYGSAGGTNNFFIINGVKAVANRLSRYVYDNPLDRPIYSSSNLGYFPGPGSQNFCFQLQSSISVSNTITNYTWSDLGNRLVGVPNYSLAYSKYLNGNISQIQIYNRALSNTECLRNYDSTKARYGL